MRNGTKLHVHFRSSDEYRTSIQTRLGQAIVFVGGLRPFQRRDLGKILSLSHGANFLSPARARRRLSGCYEAARLKGLVRRLWSLRHYQRSIHGLWKQSNGWTQFQSSPCWIMGYHTSAKSCYQLPKVLLRKHICMGSVNTVPRDLGRSS